MNTDYSDVVKNVTDQKPVEEILKTPQVLRLEKRLGEGSMFVPIVSFLLFANGMIYATRFNYGLSKIVFTGVLLSSYPVAYYFSKYVFGYTKFRELAERDIHTYTSAKYFEDQINNKI